MGCTQAKQTVQQIQDQTQKDVSKNKYFTKIIPQQINSHEQNIKSKVNWQQFSQQNDALNILSKDELSSDDFQFLLQNQIWKVQWFEYAISMLKIDQAQAKNHQSQIMKLFLRVKIRQAKFLQSQSQNSILCDQCYDNQIQKFNIKSQFIDDKLFQICKNCSALGWVKNKLSEKVSEKVSNCSICSKTINQCKIESECPNCNTFGFKWRPF